MKSGSDIVLKLLGMLLLTAAVLKGWQLLTEPVANSDIWSYRPFLILTVEFEVALAIWLVSGLFKKAAWLATLTCFTFFSFITLYKGLTGADSCGCFGSVHVNPWLTLFAIDIPAVIILAIFLPRRHSERSAAQPKNLLTSLQNLFTPLPSFPRFAATFAIGLITLGITASVLAFNKPAVVTSYYEVLEPKTWVGKELPILEYIDIADSLKEGNWLVLLYHHDCPDCIETIPKYEQMARDLTSNKDFLKIAFIEVPPYGRPINQNSPCTFGRLADIKEWFMETPVALLMVNGKVTTVWEANKLEHYNKLEQFIPMIGCFSNSGFKNSMEQ